mgnify:FL=1
MPKVSLGINVYEAALERIRFTFDNFDRIYLSFSGGKDSTAMLHLVMSEAIKRNRKIGLLVVDLEAQYKLTMDHIQDCINIYIESIDLYWICLPLHLRNAVSVFEPFWLCWDDEKKKDWVRQIPKQSISDQKYFPFFRKGMEFEEFVIEFGEWYSENKNTACLVGIRADESLNRFRSIASKKKETLNGKQYTTKITNNIYNIYPIYDWRTEDIWIFHSKFKDKRHNELYDLMQKSGLSIHLQRICQPYGDDQRRGLYLFHLIEPETWAKVLVRVNGANSGALYIQDSGNINGYGKISKPNNHTWQSFSNMILESMPLKTRNHYKNNISIYISNWTNKDYNKGIPDEAPLILESKKIVPSYRKICKMLLRNDWWGQELGMTPRKSEIYKKYLKEKYENSERLSFSVEK